MTKEVGIYRCLNPAANGKVEFDKFRLLPRKNEIKFI